jgi:hypothetical protein
VSSVTDKPLSTYFKLRRRYYRSVNLERDLDKVDAVQGYVPTERSAIAVQRILAAIADPGSHRAWTLTGVYGTGKSAFAHYLAALCAPRDSALAQAAISIAEHAFVADGDELSAIINLPRSGLFRAVATAQREPLSWTIARALSYGADSFWRGKRKRPLLLKLNAWCFQAEAGQCEVTDQQILKTLEEITEAAGTNVLLVIDELGKNLEFAAHHQGIQDLYLLQQIAELRLKGAHQIHLVGILHQSFAGYSDRLSAAEQSEWTKIQGRFTDLVFTESPSQMTRLIGQAIDRTQAASILPTVEQQAEAWFKVLQDVLPQEVSAKLLADTYPLHPITALVLPILCVRYAQNDRSLFTFLTSDELYAFNSFLADAIVQPEQIPTLKLHQLYDYFVEAVAGLSSRLNLQRWVEVEALIEDAKGQSREVLEVLKTIGILNLITSTGTFRATPQLVALALCDTPDKEEQQQWHGAIAALKRKKLIIHRSPKLQDELRIWQGSDFDVEAAMQAQIEQSRLRLAELLTRLHPLKPLVAQRHYTTTGTLRYFEQRYGDGLTDLTALTCAAESFDGLIIYWLDTVLPIPIARTTDGKPLIIVAASGFDLLRSRAQEFQALRHIYAAPEVRTDGVARREVKQRLIEIERLLDETIALAFDWSTGQNSCWIEGQSIAITASRQFQAALSAVCDRTYPLGLRLDNELINRRELTSQGAKARRELIEAMLEQSHQQRLGLTGYGPEVTMYGSVLEATGIHRQADQGWGFYSPSPDSGAATVWQAIVQFCFEAKTEPKSLEQLYQRLESPPYGVKSGVIPVLVAAVLLYYLDEVSVYKDGTFIPLLGAEHFELLVKYPERFTVKYIEVAGLRSQVFRELEAILRTGPVQGRAGSRNLTVLSVVKPLVQFVRKLPAYTLKTKRISPEAQAVIQTLLQTQEPDELLFTALPIACGLGAIVLGQPEVGETARIFRETLVQLLREIHTAYEALLTNSETLLYNAFGLRSSRDQLRQDLQFRSRYLLGNCAESSLDRFVRAAANETAAPRPWLEALVMIVADKPAEVWTEADVTLFESKLGDLARRFKNLEALQKEVAANSQGGFEARRITVTRSNGEEIHQMVWMDYEQQATVDLIVERILAECRDRATSPQEIRQLQQALLTRLTERVLGDEVRVPEQSEGQPAKPQTRHLA